MKFNPDIGSPTSSGYKMIKKTKKQQKIVGNKGEIIIYKSKKGEIELEVKIENETVWLTQAQIALLFGAEKSVITKHFHNIFKEGELSEKSNVQKMHIPNSDKPVSFYDLDAIISIGYRVNSKQATQFRIWATSILKKIFNSGLCCKSSAAFAKRDEF